MFTFVDQAFWLGLFATSGSVARVAGPLLVTELYQEFGTYVMLIVVCGTMVSCYPQCIYIG